MKNLLLALIGSIGIGIVYADTTPITSGSSFTATATTSVLIDNSKTGSEVNPIPMQFKITSDKLAGCSAIADVVPDWSANRLRITINNVLCSGNEYSTQGWVVDADSKFGMLNKSNTKNIMSVKAGSVVHVVIAKSFTLN